jgi:surface polysaccharide O-acyltransferase-like enzyme
MSKISTHTRPAHNKTRNFNLDLAKALAILGVVFLHIADGYLLRLDYFGSGLAWYLIFILRVIAGASVPIFIMTSGYLTIGKNYTFPKLFSRVLTRLTIPFLFLFIITSWMTGVSAAALHNTVMHTSLPSLADVGLKILTASSGGHFFIALIGLNLLLPVWDVVFTKPPYKIAKYLIVLGFVVAFSSILSLTFNPNISSEVLNEWRWLLWVGYFLLGYLLKLTNKSITAKRGYWLFTIGLIISLGLCFFTRKLSITNPDNQFFAKLADLSLGYHSPCLVLMSIGAWIAIVKTDFALLKKKLWQKIVEVGASLALGVYVFHGLVYSYLDVFERLGLDNMIFWQKPALAVIGLTLMTYLISSALTFIFGLFPALRMLIGNDKTWTFTPSIQHHQNSPTECSPRKRG